MNFPSELRYTADHEWVQLKDDFAVVGITEFAQTELGDIVFVDIPIDDRELNQNDVFGSVEAVKNRFRSVYASFRNDCRNKYKP